MHKDQPRPTPWRSVIVLCRKCGKRLKGGFGPKRKDPLRAALRQALRETGRRREVKVIETTCFGICPKRGVMALNATCPGMLHIIPAGASPEAALQTLLGGLHPVVEQNVVEPA